MPRTHRSSLISCLLLDSSITPPLRFMFPSVYCTNTCTAITLIDRPTEYLLVLSHFSYISSHGLVVYPRYYSRIY